MADKDLELQQKLDAVNEAFKKKSDAIDYHKAKSREEVKKLAHEWETCMKEFCRKRKALLIQYGYWDENGPIKKRTQEE